MVEWKTQTMATRKRRRWLLGLSASIVIFLSVLGFYSLVLLFDESLYTREGTFAYYLTVPDLIADAPRPGQIGQPRFYVSAGDGPKPPASAVYYQSDAARGEISRTLEAYLQSKGLLAAGTLAEVYPAGWALQRMHGEEAMVYKPEVSTRLQHVIVRVENIGNERSEISVTATF